MKSPCSSSPNESRGIPKGPSLAGCLHVYMLTCLQALGLTPMLARHRGRDSVFHCGGSDGAYADASPQPDGGTLNPAVAGLRCWVAMALAAPVVVRLGRIGPRARWLGLVVCLWGAPCCGVPFGVPCVVVPLSVAAGLSRSGTSGVRCAGALVQPLGCASVVVRCRAQAAHPLVGNLMVRIRLCPTGALVPSCAGAAAWCPYYWGAPHGATTWATPVTAGVGEPKARPEQTLRAVSVGRSRDPSSVVKGRLLVSPVRWWGNRGARSCVVVKRSEPMRR